MFVVDDNGRVMESGIELVAELFDNRFFRFRIDLVDIYIFIFETVFVQKCDAALTEAAGRKPEKGNVVLILFPFNPLKRNLIKHCSLSF